MGLALGWALGHALEAHITPERALEGTLGGLMSFGFIIACI